MGLTRRPLEGDTTARLGTGVRLSTKPNPVTCSSVGKEVFLKSGVGGEIYKHGSVREVYNRKVEMASTRRYHEFPFHCTSFRYTVHGKRFTIFPSLPLSYRLFEPFYFSVSRFTLHVSRYSLLYPSIFSSE